MDFITVKLDVEARALSFAKNDAPLAVAFSDLPTGTFSPSVKISGPFLNDGETDKGKS